MANGYRPRSWQAWQCCAGTDCRADAETVFACAAALGVGEDLQGSNELPSVTAAVRSKRRIFLCQS